MTSRHDRFGAEAVGASGAGKATAHDRAARMLDFARARAAAFAPFDLDITDIAWQLLLTLFVAQEQGKRLAVRGLCATLDLPTPVSLRWLRALSAVDLVAYDDRDGWPAPVRLTPAADTALRGLIEG